MTRSKRLCHHHTIRAQASDLGSRLWGGVFTYSTVQAMSTAHTLMEPSDGFRPPQWPEDPEGWLLMEIIKAALAALMLSLFHH